MKICIDAGHGGTDPGACHGALYEKDVVLDIALHLEKMLKNAGYEVFMTRTSDVFNTPAEKAFMANNSKADYFISIHCNAYLDPSANGTETLVYELNGEGGRLAKQVQKSLLETLETRDRGVKERKDLIVINSTRMPAILVETAFISNPDEKAILLDSKKRKAIAQAIFSGIQRHLGFEPTTEEIMDQYKKEVKKLYNFSDETIEYLAAYRFNRALFERLINH